MYQAIKCCSFYSAVLATFQFVHKTGRSCPIQTNVPIESGILTKQIEEQLWAKLVIIGKIYNFATLI